MFTERVRRGLAPARQLIAELTEAWNLAWRRSLQLRVVISTLALSTAVVLVLGLVLQTQIAQRLLQAKEADARVRTETGAVLLERDLAGVDPDREGAQGELNNALDRLTNASSVEDQPATAGEFRAVLTTSARDAGAQVSAGPVEDVPATLREAVAAGTLSSQYTTTLTEQGVEVPTLIVGQPVRTAVGDLEFYLLFPLTAEQRTLGTVQSTLIVGGLVLLLLLAGIAGIVTRQVVRPVRQAAEVAERFADGHLDERMPVQGEDEVARLAESYNEMASSIQSQIRQLEEFGALQRRFTSDVSHELRTPLTTVRMAADVLYASRDELLPALRRSSELLVAELDRFEALLADLLEISRLDAGVAELGAESVDMHGVVTRAVEAVRGIAGETRTPLELDLPVGVHAEVDPRRVERIVRNLVANAIDHSEGKPVRVVLRADERSVAVLVRDHGVGLRPGEAGLVFNRFWRAEESRARRSGGSGLGLSIAIEDARLHGGWLQAWGEIGKGAAFRLTLPRTVGDVVESSPLPLGPEEPAAPTAEPASVPTPPRPRTTTVHASPQEES
ncbi:two-component system sensor histidine kinase MtrB [Pseudonocardia hierapolitana]|uniref:Sensor histidine kinase MtrB n=1 Tax=Pseudonocardia hierapolitana TaxID=1128676 RepID=A0A561SUS2_9PSEU|nr:MtrAB system histidine kinase MtrB [Pseudonocardia hierapolitana]TWF78615.1 two-component system sensor histidine kinase MtrB [Pseudonocardia hierapolitana]